MVPSKGALLLLPSREHGIEIGLMRVVGRARLNEFGRRHAESVNPLRSWLAEATKGIWRGPQDIKDRFRSASFLAGNRVVFNIGGNKYRLVVEVAYQTCVVVVERVGTHADYDRWNL